MYTYIDVSKGSRNRLERIMELKDCTESDALDFAISMGWLIAENQAKSNHLTRIIDKKEENNGDSSSG